MQIWWTRRTRSLAYCCDTKNTLYTKHSVSIKYKNALLKKRQALKTFWHNVCSIPMWITVSEKVTAVILDALIAHHTPNLKNHVMTLCGITSDFLWTSFCYSENSLSTETEKSFVATKTSAYFTSMQPTQVPFHKIQSDFSICVVQTVNNICVIHR
jgi:hypothetical protein